MKNGRIDRKVVGVGRHVRGRASGAASICDAVSLDDRATSRHDVLASGDDILDKGGYVVVQRETLQLEGPRLGVGLDFFFSGVTL